VASAVPMRLSRRFGGFCVVCSVALPCGASVGCIEGSFCLPRAMFSARARRSCCHAWSTRAGEGSWAHRRAARRVDRARDGAALLSGAGVVPSWAVLDDAGGLPGADASKRLSRSASCSWRSSSATASASASAGGEFLPVRVGGDADAGRRTRRDGLDDARPPRRLRPARERLRKRAVSRLLRGRARADDGEAAGDNDTERARLRVSTPATSSASALMNEQCDAITREAYTL